MIELSSQYKVEEPFVQQNDHFDDKGGDEEEMYDAELVSKKISEAFDAYNRQACSPLIQLFFGFASE